MKIGVIGIFKSFVQRAKKSTGEIFYLAKFHLPNEECYVEVFLNDVPTFKVDQDVALTISIDFEKQKYFLNVA